LSHLPLVCVPFSRHISTPCKEEFSITFDDGLACLHKNAVPLLREYNFPAIFFIVSGFVGKRSEWDVYNQEHMSASQVRELLNLGFEIGSHTATHPDLTKLSPNHIKQELESSKKTLEDLLGSGIDYLSYPFGRFNETVQGIAEECGYLGAVTINPSLKSSLRDMFAIPGNAVYVFDGLYNLESKASGNNLFWIEVLKNKITNRFASGTSLFVPHHLYKREL
jgi:peptidoglycan/xylan/chitin deacetylase (PgdA/CDA1 family)